MSSISEDSIYTNGDLNSNGGSHSDPLDELFLFTSESVGEGHPGMLINFDEFYKQVFNHYYFYI